MSEVLIIQEKLYGVSFDHLAPNGPQSGIAPLQEQAQDSRRLMLVKVAYFRDLSEAQVSTYTGTSDYKDSSSHLSSLGDSTLPPVVTTQGCRCIL